MLSLVCDVLELVSQVYIRFKWAIGPAINLNNVFERVLMLNLWPNFGWNPSKHVEGRAKC